MHLLRELQALAATYVARSAWWHAQEHAEQQWRQVTTAAATADAEPTDADEPASDAEPADAEPTDADEPA